METRFLSKTAFKLGHSCPTKLYYYCKRYPSAMSDNEYVKFLAEGGHIVGKLAQLIYPGGKLIDSGDSLTDAVAATEEELKKDSVILYEAALQAGNKLVLVDILVKHGKSVKLIEVKSKSYDSDQEEEYGSKGKRTTFLTTRGTVDGEWESYLIDLCYQTYVASLAHPEFEFSPYLFLPDKSKTTSEDCLAAKFSINKERAAGFGRSRLTVDFTGDKERIANDNFMTLVNVESEVRLLWDEVRESAERLELLLPPQPQRVESKPGRHCAKCEYRVKDNEKNGFLECWGDLAAADPHIFDLYYGSTIEDGGLFDSMIASGKTSLLDVPEGCLSGKRGDRQLVQIRHSKSLTEWFSDDLAGCIKGVGYPLYFVDFETSRMAIPYHSGMRPYEQVAFQWSCHTVREPGAAPVHSEWINTEDSFPNIEFARRLMDHVGSKGTVLTWAHHESSVLNDIAVQMKRYKQGEPELREWIAGLTDKESGRILDLNKVTLQHYFHPSMKGKTSLKAVLPAVWNNSPELHEIPWLKKYVMYKDGKKVLDPYKTLEKIEIAGKAESIQEGTAAMRAYQHMLYGQGRDADEDSKEKWRTLLLQYCELDTIAMLVVWTYWEMRLGIRAGKEG